MRVVIEINPNDFNERRFRVWFQRENHGFTPSKFHKICGSREEALRIVAEILAGIPVPVYPSEAEEAYRKLNQGESP